MQQKRGQGIISAVNIVQGSRFLDCCQVSSILASGLRPCFRRFLLMQCNQEWESDTSQTSPRQEGLLPQDRMCVWRVCTLKHIWSWGGYALSTLSKHAVLHTKSRMMMQQEPVQEWVRFITHLHFLFIASSITAATAALFQHDVPCRSRCQHLIYPLPSQCTANDNEGLTGWKLRFVFDECKQHNVSMQVIKPFPTVYPISAGNVVYVYP